VSLILSAATACSACDPAFHLRRDITSSAISVECAGHAFERVSGRKAMGVASSGERWITRGGSMDVYLLLDPDTPSTATVETGGIGRESSPGVASAVRLLEDVQAALLSACGLSPGQAKIAETCLALSSCEGGS
jgi:hypothetical protein